jgi:serine phosphatase RsbU (regulator of sigma subunit)
VAICRDRLILFTDGLPDHESADGQACDLDRLAASAGHHAAAAPAAIVRELVAEVEAFAAGREAEDDQTLLVIGVTGRAGGPSRI